MYNSRKVLYVVVLNQCTPLQFTAHIYGHHRPLSPRSRAGISYCCWKKWICSSITKAFYWSGITASFLQSLLIMNHEYGTAYFLNILCLLDETDMKRYWQHHQKCILILFDKEWCAWIYRAEEYLKETYMKWYCISIHHISTFLIYLVRIRELEIA